MYRFRVIMLGSRGRGPLEEQAQALLKHLSTYAKVEVIELKEAKFKSPAERERVLKEEGEKLRRTKKDDAFRILLNERGKTFTSIPFAKQLDVWSESGARPIEFLIGGPLGTDPTLEQEVDAVLSLSPMTFPHDLARVMLFEQLYRAMTILKGKTYHY